MTGGTARIGTAGWSIPAASADQFPASGSTLERYSTCFNAVEINSSFHRPHRQTTYRRWADSTPENFRFAVKLPRTITHDRRLADCGDLVARFIDETSGLGDKRGPVLVQLPPNLAFDAQRASALFALLAQGLAGGAIVCEPRHPSWFEDEAGTLLAQCRVARVAADPPRVEAAVTPGGWDGLRYWRLHGSPQIYRSAYSPDQIARLGADLTTSRATGVESWAIYDNTMLGAATANALALRSLHSDA